MNSSFTHFHNHFVSFWCQSACLLIESDDTHKQTNSVGVVLWDLVLACTIHFAVLEKRWDESLDENCPPKCTNSTGIDRETHRHEHNRLIYSLRMYSQIGSIEACHRSSALALCLCDHLQNVFIDWSAPLLPGLNLRLKQSALAPVHSLRQLFIFFDCDFAWFRAIDS